MSYQVGMSLKRFSTGTVGIVDRVETLKGEQLITLKYSSGMFRRYYASKLEAEFEVIEANLWKVDEPEPVKDSRPLAKVYHLKDYYYEGTRLCKKRA
jgi:hypothetical protein